MTPTGDSTARSILRTLGATGLASLDADGEPGLLLGGGKPFALLVYLALAPRRTASRESLTDLLWANAEPARGRQTLRQTLSQLRQLLGDDVLTGRGQQIALSDAVRIDLDDLLSAVRRGDYLEATKLYAGPFLADFAVSGGESFDRWASGQRDRVQGAYLFALDAVIRSQLETGHAREAEPLARALRSADPFNQSAWRLLIESLLSSGNHLDARLESEELDRFLAAEGCDPEPSTRDAMLRARQIAPSVPGDADTQAVDLIGREVEFAALLAAWRRAAAGGSQAVEIVAPAGLGKTRLLEDLHQRLRARGSRALIVRAVWGERTLPFALIAALVRALAAIRGAAGVSPSTARTLVGLDPTLSSRFTVPPVVPENSAEGVRLVALAVLELLRAVSEERPLALLVDDLHWADHLSGAALGAILSRFDGDRLMLVAARRPPRTDTFAGASPLRIALAPLSHAQIGALVASIAELGDLPWEGALLDALEASTGGSPLLVLETLRFARESGLLWIDDGGWQSRDAGRLLAELGRGSSIARRVLQQPAAGQQVLLLGAAAGGALSERIVVAALDGVAEEVRASLDELERRGLITRRDGRLEMAHDQLSETVLSAATPAALGAAHRALGKALAMEPSPSPAVMQQAARHLVEGGSDGELGDLYLTWRKTARALGDQRSDRRLATTLLGDLATARRIDIALDARPLLTRFSGDAQRWAAALAGLVVVSGTALVLALMPRPARLTLVSRPLSGGNALGLVPVAVLEVQDQYGRPYSAAADTVRVSVTTPGTTLRGDTAVATVSGRASFGDVFINTENNTPLTLRFRARALPAVDVQLSGADQSTVGLFLVRAHVNGTLLTPAMRAVSVAPGDSIIGDILVRYDNDWAAASVMLAAVPTWGDKRTSYVNLGPIATPARGLRRQSDLHFRAPARPGCYRIILAFQAEDDVKYIASGTNWSIGRPIWGDGNDVADWSPQQIARADSSGVAMSAIVRKHGAKVERTPNLVAATTLEVRVRENPAERTPACPAH